MGWLGDVIGGVGSLATGLGIVSGRSAEEQNNLDYDRQKEFAQNGIRWRVADAQAAGVHPLFALGANASGFSPSPVIPDDVGLSQVGQGIGNGISAAMDTEQRDLTQQQLSSMAAAEDKDRAEGSYWEAMAAKTRQDMNASSPWPQRDLALSTDQDTYFRSQGDAPDPQLVWNPYSDAIVRKANWELMSSDSGRPIGDMGTGGQQSMPAWSEWDYDNNFKLQLPYAGGQGGSLAESMEGIPMVAWPMIIKRNTEIYGNHWAVEFARKFPGITEAIQRLENVNEALRGSKYEKSGKLKKNYPEPNYSTGF